MVDISANSTVYPSANDIAETEKEGRYATEQSHTELLQLWVESHVVSGFVLPASDPDLTITVPSGEAVGDGHRVVVSTSTDIALSPSNTNYIWLQLSFDGDGNVDGVEMISTTSSSPASNAVKIGEAVTGPGSVTSTKDFRRLGKPIIDEAIWGPSAALHLGDNDTAFVGSIDSAWVDIAGITLTSEDLKGVDHRILVMASGTFEISHTPGITVQFRFYDKTQSAVIGARAQIQYSTNTIDLKFAFALQDSDVLDGSLDHTVTLQAQQTGSGTADVRDVALDVISTGKA